MKEKPKYISGIYNYCDRWCERCMWTGRCKVYAELEKDGLNESDIPAEKFWKSLAANYAKTFIMLDKYMKEHNIVITEEEKEEIGRKEEELHKKVEEHQLVRIAIKYRTKADRIFKKWQNIFNPDQVESLVFSQPVDPVEYLVKLEDATEVLSFYHFQIQVKIMRALSSILEDDPYKPPKGYISDSDGSAAVALMGIERLMAAWSFLLEQLPELEDEILECLSILKILEAGVDKTFPMARKEHSKYWGGILAQC
jgi:hypothetical protein